MLPIRCDAEEDLNGYRILFGPLECDEKHAAVLDLLKQANVTIPDEIETTVACSDGACKIIEWGDTERAAAVISSYAKPLLEGCGTIEKGELRVIAETEPVPFITAFVNESLPAELQHALQRAARCRPRRQSSHSTRVVARFRRRRRRQGFAGCCKKKLGDIPVRDWNGWRGPLRDAIVPWLPVRLPEHAALHLASATYRAWAWWYRGDESLRDFRRSRRG